MAEEQKFNFPTPLNLACADDELRPILEYVHFVEGFAYATNAHVMIKQSLDEYCTVIDKANLNGHSFHKDSFDNIRKFDVATANEEGVECYDHNGGKKAFFPYGNPGIPPNFDAVSNGLQATNIPFIGINTKNIEIAGKCLAKDKSSAVRLSFHGVDKAIVATVEGYPEQHAIIMPLILGGSLF